jgi:hypothetical protein
VVHIGADGSFRARLAAGPPSSENPGRPVSVGVVNHPPRRRQPANGSHLRIRDLTVKAPITHSQITFRTADSLLLNPHYLESYSEPLDRWLTTAGQNPSNKIVEAAE